jgi:hypothetical protein
MKPAILTHLAIEGIEVRALDPDTLLLTPKAKVTPEIVEMVRPHKAEILAALAADAAYNAARQLARRCEATGRDLAETVAALGPEDRRLLGEDFVARVERSCAVSAIEGATCPGRTLITICRNYGVTLRVDDFDGTLVIGPGAWRSLVRAIAAHVDEIAELLITGRANDA